MIIQLDDAGFLHSPEGVGNGGGIKAGPGLAIVIAEEQKRFVGCAFVCVSVHGAGGGDENTTGL